MGVLGGPEWLTTTVLLPVPWLSHNIYYVNQTLWTVVPRVSNPLQTTRLPPLRPAALHSGSAAPASACPDHHIE